MRRRHLGFVMVAMCVSGCASAGVDEVAAPVTTLPTATTDDVFVPAPSEGRASLPVPATSTTTTVPPTTTTVPPTTTSTIPPTTTTMTSTTVAPVAGPAEGAFDFTATDLLVGTSVEGRSIIAERHGTIGGRRVLVIGVIHGNEDAGVAVIDELRRRSILGSIPDDVELWLIESMNPDGQAAQVRQNANQVDLNRNFPHEWGPIGDVGTSQYAGTGPASEPETQAMVAFISQLAPDIAIWYHQDANLIIPSTGRQGRIRSRYAELTGLPLAECCSGGGVYTGIAATWARVTLSAQEAVPFIVELPGGDLSPEQVEQHSTAVLTIASEG